jgi:uncharacterized protein YjbI with pentapeptide repeats
VSDVYAGLRPEMVDDAHYSPRAPLEGDTAERATSGAAGSDNLVRLVSWFVGLVLVMAIASVVFVPTAHWLARRDIGSAREPLLQAASVIEQKRPLELFAVLFTAGASLALAQSSIMARRMRKSQREADPDAAQAPDPGLQLPGQLIVVTLPDEEPGPLAPDVSRPPAEVSESAPSVAARVMDAADEDAAVREPAAADVCLPQPGTEAAELPERGPVATQVGAGLAADVTRPAAVEPAKAASGALLAAAVAAGLIEPEPVSAPGTAAEAAAGVRRRYGGSAEHRKRRRLFAAGARFVSAQDSMMARRIRKVQQASSDPVDAEAQWPELVAAKLADPTAAVNGSATAVAAGVTGAAEETTAQADGLVAGSAAARAADRVREPEYAADDETAESEPAVAKARSLESGPATGNLPEPEPVSPAALEAQPVAAAVRAGLAAAAHEPVTIEVTGAAPVAGAVATEVPHLEPVAASGSAPEATDAVWDLLQLRCFPLPRGQPPKLDGQLSANGRYASSIEMLGSQELQVRVDGIHALEGVARDSAADHPAVIEVLTAFIEEHSHELWPPRDSFDLEQNQWVRPDVQAALTVIGRTNKQSKVRPADLVGARLVRADLIWANLSGTDLSWADLSVARLHGAYLTRANLTGARLVRTNLTRANLSRAHLRGAYLTRAHLSFANLSLANLTGADLTAADLHGADLTGADLTGAYLTGANLTGANLTRVDLTGAVLLRACVTDADVSGAKLSDALWSRQAEAQAGWPYE